MPPPTPAPPGLHTALSSDEWFSACDPALQSELLRLARIRHLAAGESLFARGGEADGLCCVVAGALRIGALNAEGHSSLLAWLEPYQWFGEISLIDEQPRTHDAVADGPSQVLLVPRGPLLAWLEGHPAVWRDMARLACRKLRVLFVALEELAQLPLEERVWRRLQLVARGYDSRDTPRRHIRLSQEALAQMLGVSRQSINKALKTLEAGGRLCLHYGEIELLGANGNPGSAAPAGPAMG
ncbi:MULTISPECIES: Crp/Fnr family transcriptional regulator [Hydrogenophaga]|uniref:Transcriptional regulator n=1 Tax=Hydrogenophaga electricum TaxID=1230953 RepID=A0ABQ6C689_9BURK|nr:MULTISPECIES: Crp/Fnr family transcriptional regulator [Hydrogenophaga]GLS15851.1 transcriptional regulator [Hydrogenophaga electricum]